MIGLPPISGTIGGVRRTAALLVVAFVLLAACAPTRAWPALPGAPGVGDPYYPLDGNGGYDVQDYRLDIAYDPVIDVLTGTTTIRARATQDLSAFNLDLSGLEVREVAVNGAAATATRAGDELTITPAAPLALDSEFTAVIRYDGVPINDQFGLSGFFTPTTGRSWSASPTLPPSGSR